MVGRFIVFEGIEGAGKSSQLKALKTTLEQKGYRVCLTREPGGTPIAEKLRCILAAQDTHEPLSAKTELLLMYASRLQHIEHVIQPALQDGQIVLCDRFFWSSFAYQSGGRGIPLEQVQQLNHWAIGHFMPDLTVYLDIPPSVGLARAAQVGQPDRFEQQKVSFFSRARQVFYQLVQQFPDTSCCIDAQADFQTVQRQIIQFVIQAL